MNLISGNQSAHNFAQHCWECAQCHDAVIVSIINQTVNEELRKHLCEIGRKLGDLAQRDMRQ